MSPPEDQHDFSTTPSYFDPEEFDMSEQQFSASLEEQDPRPSFVLDRSPDGANRPPPTSGPALTLGGGAPGLNPTGDNQTGGSFLADNGLPPHAKEGTVPDAEPESSSPDPTSNWREQVSAKVNRYRSRRPRKERFPSLQLEFDATPYRAPERPSEASRFEPEVREAAIPPASRPAADVPIVLDATARVIEFPRALPAPVPRDELAEPVVDRPRILDVPESLPAPPAMGGILIEPRTEPQPERRPGFDIPLRSAQLRRRVWAAAVDGLLVGIGVAAFACIFLRFATVVPPWRTDVELIAALFGLLWPAYQCFLLVYCGTTPGLRLAGLGVRRFDGGPVPRKLRKWRVLASMLSAISLGLGYAWCFLDEDQLSWHDRITRTHLADDRSTRPAQN
jgi:uncharacterized RDD family membrane protein YckC